MLSPSLSEGSGVGMGRYVRLSRNDSRGILADELAGAALTRLVAPSYPKLSTPCTGGTKTPISAMHSSPMFLPQPTELEASAAVGGSLAVGPFKSSSPRKKSYSSPLIGRD